jgi:hypothetical protein
MIQMLDRYSPGNWGYPSASDTLRQFVSLAPPLKTGFSPGAALKSTGWASVPESLSESERVWLT